MRKFLVVGCFFSLQVAASVVVVDPNLPIGVSIDNSTLSPYWQSANLADGDRPNGMGVPISMMHLGTNADLFSTGSGNYWVRYTLGPTSSLSSIYNSSVPLTGAFWLNFNRTSGGYSYSWFFDKVLLGTDPGFYLKADANQDTSCGYVGCRFNGPFQSLPFGPLWNLAGSGTSLTNLSFLQFEWNQNANRYDIQISSSGFDEVFKETSNPNEMAFTQFITLNIAPVPLPSPLCLLFSGVAWLIGVARTNRT